MNENSSKPTITGYNIEINIDIISRVENGISNIVEKPKEQLETTQAIIAQDDKIINTIYIIAANASPAFWGISASIEVIDEWTGWDIEGVREEFGKNLIVYSMIYNKDYRNLTNSYDSSGVFKYIADAFWDGFTNQPLIVIR